MKYLVEQIGFDEVQILQESVLIEGKETKRWHIKGPYVQAEKPNENRRIYREHIVIPAINTYKREFIDPCIGYGCNGHPPTPKTDMDKVAMRCLSLVYDPALKYGMGDAIVLDTPQGKICQNMLETGGKLCVSTRGVGSLSEGGNYSIVNDDWRIIAIDIVHEPSGQDCHVAAIMEAKDWILNEHGEYEPIFESFENKLAKNGSNKNELKAAIKELLWKI